jgi:hypothetical protein
MNADCDRFVDALYDQAGTSVMSQVLQVVESSVVTIILTFAEEPQVLRRTQPRLYDNFKRIYGSVCDLFADDEDQEKAGADTYDPFTTTFPSTFSQTPPTTATTTSGEREGPAAS